MRRSHIDDKIAAMMAQVEVAPKPGFSRGHKAGCSTKDRYASEDSARAVALMNGMAQKLTVYRCESCSQWHLSRIHKGT